jgi:hypothetical protein
VDVLYYAKLVRAKEVGIHGDVKIATEGMSGGSSGGGASHECGTHADVVY